MSIDAVVVGVRKVNGEYKLTLEDRPGGGPAGQHTLRILNPETLKARPPWAGHLQKLIGCELWGGCSDVMLGDKRLASREGYTGIRLVDDWQDVVEAK